MRNIVLLALLTIATITKAQQQTLNLLPVPKKMELQNGLLPVAQNFTVSIDADATDTILFAAVNRMYQTLNRTTGLFFSQQYILPKEKNSAAALLIHVDKRALPAIGTDESYSLKITPQQININAPNTTGALHAFETLIQLLQKNNNAFSFPCVVIEDAPRFQWRGLMIDVARHFSPVDVIKRNIDAMASVKMNVLHLHLSDNEGFRIESKLFPALQDKGSNGDFYTQAQMKDLIGYAKERGIIIVPEFDMPGHTQAWFAGYPELASAPGPYQPGPPFKLDRTKPFNLGAIMQMMTTAPFPAFDPSKESTYAFIDKFLGEMSLLFPAPYIHIGADENNGVVWKNNPDIVAFMTKNDIPDTNALQAYFVQRVQELVKKHNRQMIGWEELFSKDLSKDVMVQVWQNAAYLKRVSDHDNAMLFSKGFYLDLFMPAYIHYNNPDLLSVNDDALLKGGEAAQWTEIADKNNIETRMWPRAAAIAERLWSPSSVTDVDDMYRRLFVVSHRLDQQGLQHISAYERALRCYTNGDDISDLKNFTDVLSPIKGYKKVFAKFTQPESATYQAAPLIALSDIIPVDAEMKWKFRSAVKSYLQNKDAVSENYVLQYLTAWQSNYDKIKGLFNNDDALKAVQPHAQNLSVAASIGIDAMNRIKNGTTPDMSWTNDKLNILKKASQPYAETELSVIPEIEALVKGEVKPLPATYPVF